MVRPLLHFIYLTCSQMRHGSNEKQRRVYSVTLLILTFDITGKVGWMTILVWSCYPIVWLFSEGFASFSVSFEITMYAILDVVNKVR